MDITTEQRGKIGEMGNKYNLRFVILHGSYAKNTVHQGSDLDIAILGKEPVDFDAQLKIFGEFEELFGNSKERELDLKTLHGVDSLFRYEVTRDGDLLFGDQTAYEEFKAYAYRDYMDSRDFRELEFSLLKKSINSLTRRYAH